MRKPNSNKKAGIFSQGNNRNINKSNRLFFKIFLLGIILLCCLSKSKAQNPGDNLFSGIKVHTINITMTQNSYWDSLVYYYNQGLEHYMTANITIDGTELNNIGIRLKGNASYSHKNDKKPMRLSFDEFNEDLRFDGLKGVHLNNCWNDPTFIRENMQLNFLNEAGIPAPRSTYAMVYINNVVWGLYSVVEHVNKQFLSAHYGNKDGNLYKAVDAFGGAGGGTTQYLSDFKYYGSDTSYYNIRYELKTDESTDRWSGLISFLNTLNNTSDLTTIFPSKVNTTNFYRAIATDIIFANMDSYTDSGRNFYFYMNPETGKLDWIVWDVNMNFGLYKGSASDATTISLTHTSSASGRPLIGKVFNNSALKLEYYRQFYSLFTKYFNTTKMFARIDSIASVIRPYVVLDTRKEYTVAQFDANITSSISTSSGGQGGPGGGSGESKPGLKSFLTARKTNIESQFAALGLDLSYSIKKGDVVINEFMAKNSAIKDPANDTDSWIELYNTTSEDIDLSNTYLSNDASTPKKWLIPSGTTIAKNGFLIIWMDEETSESGVHASFKLSESGGFLSFTKSDGTLLDSTSYSVQTTDYSMARIPNGTGSFVKCKATHGTTNVTGTLNFGDVVINEFMAQNSTIADPAGEYDDWVELHNNTSLEIDLGGMYLSDSYSSPTKWQIPTGTKIPAKGYLVIWTDEDTDQSGVHATFKLSVSGEQLILSDVGLAIIDSTTFSTQTTDKSTARIPDGTGSFKQVTTATPGSANSDNVNAVEKAETTPSSYSLKQNYPNPFNPSTSITFSIPKDSYVKLEIYNILGQHISTLVNTKLISGTHNFTWNANAASSGFYLYKLTAKATSGESFVQVKKMMLMK